MLPFLIPIIGSVVKTATGWFTHKQKMKEARQASELEWAKYMAQASGKSWKDEYLTLVWTLPILLAIFGYVTPLERLLVILKEIPEWYTYLLLTITLASFGLSATGKWKEVQTRRDMGLKRLNGESTPDNTTHGTDFGETSD